MSRSNITRVSSWNATTGTQQAWFEWLPKSKQETPSKVEDRLHQGTLAATFLKNLHAAARFILVRLKKNSGGLINVKFEPIILDHLTDYRLSGQLLSAEPLHQSKEVNCLFKHFQ